MVNRCNAVTAMGTADGEIEKISKNTDLTPI